MTSICCPGYHQLRSIDKLAGCGVDASPLWTWKGRRRLLHALLKRYVGEFKYNLREGHVTSRDWGNENKHRTLRDRMNLKENEDRTNLPTYRLGQSLLLKLHQLLLKASPSSACACRGSVLRGRTTEGFLTRSGELIDIHGWSAVIVLLCASTESKPRHAYALLRIKN